MEVKRKSKWSVETVKVSMGQLAPAISKLGKKMLVAKQIQVCAISNYFFIWHS